MSISDTHDKVQKFPTRLVLIRGPLMRFPFQNVEVLHTWRMSPFRFSQEIVMIPSESDIPPALAICSVVIGPHVRSTPIDHRAPVLCMAFFVATNFQIAPLLHPQLPLP